jgi:uncharacterized protein (TIGR03437 family)
MGPQTLAIDPKPFTNPTLMNTSVNINVGGTNVAALMYYSSAGQVAALLPSNTPLGAGTITVTYNNVASTPAPITVVQNNPGIFTTPPGGTGAAVITFPDYSVVSSLPVSPCGGPYTACGAANPKDILIAWITGLGPVNGSDSAGAGLGQNMPNIPLKLFIGGVQANISYQGRSGCCVGLDQIVFTVPDNVPLGCSVPMFMQIGNVVSNFALIPIASGSRSCAPLDSSIVSSGVAAVATGAPFNTTKVKLRARGMDHVDAMFEKLTVVPGMFPFVLTLADIPTVGLCTVYNSVTLDLVSTYFVFQRGLDAGPALTIKGPKGNTQIPKTATPSQPTDYFMNLGTGYFTPGDYTVTGTGGADVGPFAAMLTIPTVAAWNNMAVATNVTRTSPLTINWTAAPSQFIAIIGASYATADQKTGAYFQCLAQSEAGSFTIPANVLMALPAAPLSPNGSITVQSFSPSANFTATGLTFASMDFNVAVGVPTTFK